MWKWILVAVVAGLLLLAAASRLVAQAVAAERPVASSQLEPRILDDGWKKQFKTIRSPHACTWNGRLARCMKFKVYVHRYGHLGGLIYNSGHILSVIWRNYDGTDRWCLRCILHVHRWRFVDTLAYDLSWDEVGPYEVTAAGPCTIGEHRFGHGCGETWRKTTTKFVNHRIFGGIALDNYEVAGVSTHLYIGRTPSSGHGGLMIASRGICC